MISNTEKNISLIKPQFTEHAAWHKLEIDKSYWKLQLKKDSAPASYFSVIRKSSIVSRPFTADDDGEVFWKIRLERVYSDETKLHYCLEMTSKSDNINVLLYASYSSVLDGPYIDKTKQYDVLITSSTIPSCYNPVQLDKGIKFVRVSIKYAKIHKFEEVTSLISQPSETHVRIKRKRSVSNDTSSLLKNQFASDVTLKAKDKEWKLHKCILMNASSAFAAMFNNNMTESNKGVVEIQDADIKALDLMIKFIYNDDLDHTDMRSEAKSLIYLADKYDLSELKENCEESLIHQLTAENCLQFFVVADKLNAKLLRKSAKGAIVRNLSSLLRSDEYKEFAMNNWELSLEITEHGALKKDTN